MPGAQAPGGRVHRVEHQALGEGGRPPTTFGRSLRAVDRRLVLALIFFVLAAVLAAALVVIAIDSATGSNP